MMYDVGRENGDEPQIYTVSLGTHSSHAIILNLFIQTIKLYKLREITKELPCTNLQSPLGPRWRFQRIYEIKHLKHACTFT